MATIDLGRIKPVWQGTWAGSTAYEVEDIVRYGADSYICTTAHTSDASTFTNDSANWELMAQGSDLPTQSGQAGKALVTDGSTLSWGNGGSLVLLASGEIPGVEVSTLQLNYFTTTYSNYVILLDNLETVNTANIQPYMRFNNSGTARTASQYHWATSHPHVSSGGGGFNGHAQWNDSRIKLHGLNGLQGGSAPIGGVNAEIRVYDPMNSDRWTHTTYQSAGLEQSETQFNVHNGGALYRAREAHNGVTIGYDGDNLKNGNWAVYGVVR